MTNKDQEQLNATKIDELKSILEEKGIEVKSYNRFSYFHNVPIDFKYKQYYITNKYMNKAHSIGLFYLNNIGYSINTKLGSTGNFHYRKGYDPTVPRFFNVVTEEYTYSSTELPHEGEQKKFFFKALKDYLIEGQSPEYFTRDLNDAVEKCVMFYEFEEKEFMALNRES